MRDLYRETMDRFDAVLADDRATRLANRAMFLSIRAYRALWAYNKGLRMGRDDAGELAAALSEVGKALGFDLHDARSTGEYFQALAEATGLDHGMRSPEEVRVSLSVRDAQDVASILAKHNVGKHYSGAAANLLADLAEAIELAGHGSGAEPSA